MGETHAYGSSMGIISRRLFLIGASSVMAALCIIQLIKWLLRSHLWSAILGNSWTAAHPRGCTGTACYEVLSCFGMKDATLHLREPLVTVTGSIVLPLGVAGAHHLYRWHLRVLAGYLTVSTCLHLTVLLSDVAFMHYCGMYPTNVIEQTLTNWWPLSPLTDVAQDRLRRMATYPIDEVVKVSNSFPVTLWYLGMAGALTVFLAYVAREAWLLGDLAERGPLGLGVHYGIAQWDQFISYDAMRRHMDRNVKSKFIEDCVLPVPRSRMDNTGLDFTYGATQTTRGGVAAAPAPEPLWLERHGEEEEEEEDDEEAAVAAAAAAQEEEEQAAIAACAAAEAEAEEAAAAAAAASAYKR